MIVVLPFGPHKWINSAIETGFIDKMKQLSIGVALVVGVLLGAAGAMRSQQSATGTQQAGTQRIVQFENDDVKVWKSIVVPNAPLTMHRHEHGRVIIALKGGTMKIVEQSGGSEAHVWETGKAYWLPKNAPNTMHADVNAGDQPIEVMVVEMKKDK
jgi:beta-alanine degradation protein BauB